MRIYTSLLLPAFAAAGALPKQPESSHFCSQVNSIVTRWSEQSAAISYCSSFLHISPHAVTASTTPTKTVTVSVTLNKSTATITETATVTSTRTSGVTITSTSTETDTLGITYTTTVTSPLTSCDRPFRKREALRAPPHWTFSNNEETSSACSCLSLYASTITNTKTAPTATVTSTMTKNVIATVTVTRTATKTATIATFKTTTITTKTTTTIRSTATATNVSPIKIGGSTNGPPTVPYRLTCPSSKSTPDYLCNFATGVTGETFYFNEQSSDFQLQKKVPHIGSNYLGISGGGGSYSAFVTADANTSNGYPHLSCQIESGSSGECPVQCTVTNDAGTQLPFAFLCNGNLWQYASSSLGNSDCVPLEIFAFAAS